MVDSERKIVPRCHIPWQQMVVDSTGAVNPCAYYGGYGNFNPNIGDLNTQSIWEIWNNEAYQRLRRHMANGDLVAAGCANCYAIKEGLPLGLDYDVACDAESGAPKSRYAVNIEILKQEVAAGAHMLEAAPTIVSYTPSHRCNLRCIQCYQTSTRTQEFNRNQADAEIKRLAPTLVRLIAGGGEPFLLNVWKTFVGEFDISENPYLEFSTTTNATLIDERVEAGLRRFKKVSFSISLDAIEQGYEHIRVGAKWTNTLDNIRKLKQIVQEKREANSSLAVTACVMKSSILHLPDFVRFALREGIGFGISPVVTMPPNESLICYNQPVEVETQGWIKALNEASDLVSAADGLSLRQKESYLRRFSLVAETLKIASTKYSDARRYRLKIPEQIVSDASKLFDAPLVAYVFPWGQRTGTAAFWSPVAADGSAEIWLPVGAWAITLANQWNNAGPTRNCGFVVRSLAHRGDLQNIDVHEYSRLGWWWRRISWGRESVRVVAKEALIAVMRRIFNRQGMRC